MADCYSNYMPTVKLGNHGYYIVSNRRGKYITHQLSKEGVEILRARHGTVDGLDIDVNTLLSLKERGCATTGRQRRNSRPRNESTKQVSVTPEPSRTYSNNVVCEKCRAVVANSPYCSRCGASLSRKPQALGTQPKAGFNPAVVALVVIIIVILLISKLGR